MRMQRVIFRAVGLIMFFLVSPLVLGACQARPESSRAEESVSTSHPAEKVSGFLKVAADTTDPLELIEAGNCDACHTIPGVPDANGIAGPSWCDPAQEVKEGKIRAQDIVAMIVAPQSEVEEGFLDVMPTIYGQMFSPEQVDVLANFISSLNCEGFEEVEPEPITPADTDPRMLMRKAGCVGCHAIPGVEGADGTIGPNMCDPAEEFRDGEITKADIIEFIVDPGAEVVEGYPDVMPRVYKDVFTDEQLNILADFIAGLECQ